MLTTLKDTAELKRTYQAWETVMNETFPTVFRAFRDYNQANNDIAKGEREYRLLTDSEEKLRKYANDAKVMGDFFAMTESEMLFSTDFESKLIQISEKKEIKEDEINNNRSFSECQSFSATN